MELTKPALNEANTESGVHALLHEWLAYYFDGGEHTIGGQTLTFPEVTLAFGQGPPRDVQARESVEIRCVVLARAENSTPAATSMYSGRFVTDFVVLNFWIHVKKAGTGQSEYLAQEIADRLKLLCGNPDARYALALKGIRSLQPQGPAQWIPSVDYAQRMLAVNAQLQYAIVYQN